MRCGAALSAHAHSVSGSVYIRYAIGQTRRGGLEPGGGLIARPLALTPGLLRGS